ncbi:Bax inhibitor-1/YccA family protein [Prolixibacter sp. NT017]|uniref:Bax inhibitor-1/YccA family protein n=1 Tax=Prolixibacter sp. NT017 TaxID=2652390 RepID=UPI001277D513|nr:Bax inhibitor-1/YccA family protein [Prolixibacter sp. NT017]GET25961.1 membrane protein [Prolixibacter sp. NT017]
MDNYIGISREEALAETQRFFVKVYSWMSFALLVTGGVAMWTAMHVDIVRMIVQNRMLFFGLIIGEFLMVGYLVGWIQKMSAQTATLVFVLYSVLNGLTFSVIFLLYTAGSIASTFFITAGTFAAMSAYGYFTKSDLTRWGSLLFMGLIGVIIASVVNMFFHSPALYWFTTYAGVLIFVGLTAYDTQKIKKMNVIGNEGTEEDKKEAIVGALILYLDFINLFLLLLRLFGRRR